MRPLQCSACTFRLCGTGVRRAFEQAASPHLPSHVLCMQLYGHTPT